jgi:4-hydroxy-tetrahydrodipicolinate reductase
MEFSMKIGIVGRGKTGQAVIDVLQAKPAQVFSRENPLTMDKLFDLDSLIVFVPADGLKEIMPNLIESVLPVVCGTTAYPWPSDFSAELKKRNLTWITGSNFSPGMNLMFAIASLVQSNREFLGKPELRIHDLHHVHKKDSPSGTALKLRDALAGQAEIHAERMGEHPGLHEVFVTSDVESLAFKHEAKSRRAFAEGAVFAAQKLLPNLGPGLHSFESLMKTQIFKNLGEPKA